MYTRGQLVNDGGEGLIYEVKEDPSLLMKVYREADSSGSKIVTDDLFKKLKFMKYNPPEALISRGVVAWPMELMTDKRVGLTGYIMPRLDFDEHLLRAYGYRHPILDENEYERYPSVRSRIMIAINLCSALHELHNKGYIFGDFNHHNIGIKYGTGQICFMDCDSFHITDNTGHIHRTSVIMAGYLAPEIINHCKKERVAGNPYNLDDVSLPTFTKESDLFCLGIHIFKLLMNGVDPFRGVKSDAVGSTASPFLGNDAIERNSYVFREGNKPSAVFCPPAESLPPGILKLFDDVFIHGRPRPTARPSAETWYHTLNNYLKNELADCSNQKKHQYWKEQEQCPYCIADEEHFEAQGGERISVQTKPSYPDPPPREKKPLRTALFSLVALFVIVIGVAIIFSNTGDNDTPVIPAAPPVSSTPGVSDLPVAEPFTTASDVHHTETETYDDGSYTILEYDTNGNLVKASYYSAGGETQGWAQSEFDSLGQQTKYTWFDENGYIEYSGIFEYDNRGNNTKTTWFTAEGNIESITESEYDFNNNLILSSYYNAYGELVGWRVYEHDANGNHIGSIDYSENGEILSWNEYIYYDDGSFKDIYYSADGSRTEYEYIAVLEIYVYTFFDIDGSISYFVEYDRDWNVINEWYS